MVSARGGSGRERGRGATKGPKARGSYHHGDLRAALVAAAVRLVEEEGVGALGLRAVARAVGVSHAAPYNHFADRASLVAAVAAEGFVRMSAAMEERMRSFVSRPARQLQEAGITYVGFAVSNPELFRLMFSPELADKGPHAALREAANRSMQVLAGAIERSGGAPMGSGTGSAAVVAGGAPPLGPFVAWSFVHGLAVLLLDEQLGKRPGKAAAERIALDATELLWEGLKGASAR